jgi:hypothetical protein
MWCEGKYCTFGLIVSNWDYFCIKEVSRKLIFYNRDNVFFDFLDVC